LIAPLAAISASTRENGDQCLFEYHCGQSEYCFSAEFKHGTITGETFVETDDQFKQDKAELENQIKAKLKKE
jgi:hypothetical protein